MNRRLTVLFLTGLTCSFIGGPGRGQGTFVNLNFEAANVPANTRDSTLLTQSQAFPGWTIISGGGPYYDGISLAGATVNLWGPNFGPLQGNYSVYLMGDTSAPIGPPVHSAEIAQTGQVPQNTQTLIFWANPGNSLQAAFDGQMLPLIQIGSGANYVVEAANISSYAGKTGQLSFTAPILSARDLLDNIQFSPNPLSVPEPTTSSLLLGGAALFALAHWKRPV